MLGEPYNLGQNDCLLMFLNYFEAIGIKMPDQWNGWTRQNYAERWARGEGREEYYQFLTEQTMPVDINFIRRGDIVIFKHEDIMYIAIYQGNDNVMLVTDKIGTTIMPLWAIRGKVTEVRRCHH